MVAHVICVSPQSQLDLDFNFGLVLVWLWVQEDWTRDRGLTIFQSFIYGLELDKKSILTLFPLER